MLTKKRIRINSKRSKKFLLVGGASRDDVIKDMAERLNIFKGQMCGCLIPLWSGVHYSGTGLLGTKLAQC